MLPKAAASSGLSCDTFPQCRGHYSSLCCSFNVPREKYLSTPYSHQPPVSGAVGLILELSILFEACSSGLFPWLDLHQVVVASGEQGKSPQYFKALSSLFSWLGWGSFGYRKLWWGFQNHFCVSKSESKGYPTIWFIPALACFTSRHGCWMTHLLEYSYF